MADDEQEQVGGSTFGRGSRELSRRISEVWARGAEELPDRPLLLPLFFFAWLLPLLSNWLPLLLAAWAAFQYERYKHSTLLEGLNNRWKRHILYTSPKTPLEPCEWINKLMTNLWPSFLEPKLSNMFSTIMMKRLKEKRPHPFRSIELQEFSLGIAPPSLGLQRTYWLTESDEQALHMGFEWETNEMKVLLAAKLAGPFKGVARFVINSLHIKGDLRIVPILDGQAFVYSFTSRPEVRIGLAFGGGQSLPATELPPVASWLERVFLDTMVRTMVEPQRRCFPLPAVSMKKRATGGVISVTVISAENLAFVASSRVQFDRRSCTNGSRTTHGGSSSRLMTTFVEVTLEGLTRSTQVSQHCGAPRWNDSFQMILHESAGTIHFNVYEHGSSNIKYDFRGSCEVKVKYVDDGSTIFWTSGSKDQVLADRAENCGKEVAMEIPIHGYEDAKLFVKLVVKEWQFIDGSRTGDDYANGTIPTLQYLPSFETHTGRTLRITVLEGRNLAAKDRTGKSDPYVRLRYGKLERKTKIMKQDLNPIWKQGFEFPEIGNGEHLQLNCYDADYFNDENLGSARVNLEGLVDGISREVWIPLEKINTGEIRLIIEAYISESEAESLQNGESEEHALNSRTGILEVVLVEARDLVAADLRGTSDPFVSIHCGNEKRTTKIIHKTLHPQWSQTFEMSDTGKPLILYVKDHNALLPDSNIGHCKVEYERLPTNQMVDKWIPLQGIRKGEIHVQVTRWPPKSCRRYTSNGPSNKLLKKSGKVQTLLKQVLSLASTGDTDAICKKLEEIEMVEDEKSVCMSRLLRERDLLLEKIKDLGEAIEGKL